MTLKTLSRLAGVSISSVSNETTWESLSCRKLTEGARIAPGRDSRSKMAVRQIAAADIVAPIAREGMRVIYNFKPGQSATPADEGSWDESKSSCTTARAVSANHVSCVPLDTKIENR